MNSESNFEKCPIDGNFMTIGSVQLGKSLHIIQKSIYLIKNNINVIIITNCSLKEQFKERFKKLGFKDTKHLHVITNNKKIGKILSKNKNNCSIYIIGAHDKNITSLYDKWIAQSSRDNKSHDANNIKNCYIMIDEGDLFNDPDNKAEVNKITTAISEFKKIAIGNEVVTATPYSYTYLNDKFPIPVKNINFIDKTDDYVSFGHPKFFIESIKNLYTAIDTNYLRKNLRKITKDAYTKLNKNLVMYINITEDVNGEIVSHRVIANLLKELYSTRCCIITANNSEYIYHNKNNVRFKTKSISSALECYKNDKLNKTDKGQSTKKRIFIISSKQTGRGHSMRTTGNIDYTLDKIMYANCAIFCCSSGLTTDQIMQQALRIGGRFPGHDTDENFKLILYTTDDIKNKITKQHTEDIANYEAIKLKCCDDEENQESDQETVFMTELIRPTVNKMHPVVSKSRGNHKQKKIGDLYYQTKDTLAKVKEVDDTENIENTENTEIIENTIRKEWTSGDTIISRFMLALVANYKNAISKEDFIKMATEAGSSNPEQFLLDCMKTRNQKSNGYGVIFTQKDHEYRLRTELHQQFEDVFLV